MADPFAYIDEEYGNLTASQESEIRRFPVFSCLPNTSDDDDENTSLPPADAPILFHSLPDSPDAPVAADAAVPAVTSVPADTAVSADAAATADFAALNLGLPASTTPAPKPGEDGKPRHQCLETLKDVLMCPSTSNGRTAESRIKLPASVVKRVLEIGGKNTGRDADLPRDLPELVKYFSEDDKKKYANIDILDIAKIKGIELAPLSWWRPGGYENTR